MSVRGVRRYDTVIKIRLRSIRLTVGRSVGEARARNADVPSQQPRLLFWDVEIASNTRESESAVSEVSTIQREDR